MDQAANGPNQIVWVVLDLGNEGARLPPYTAFDENPDQLGRILFDVQGYWIYDSTEIL
jgi:hypothetical protein